jgi:hypothetical protein
MPLRDYSNVPSSLPTGARKTKGAGAFSVLESFHARLATPFAVLGIRTAGNLVARIEYLPRGAATLKPVNALAGGSLPAARVLPRRSRF